LKEQQQEQLQLASVFDAPNAAASLNVAPSPPPPDNKSKLQIADLEEQVKSLQEKVRLDEERSDDLAMPSQAKKTA
jgi:hypothetical protein